MPAPHDAELKILAFDIYTELVGKGVRGRGIFSTLRKRLIEKGHTIPLKTLHAWASRHNWPAHDGSGVTEARVRNVEKQAVEINAKLGRPLAGPLADPRELTRLFTAVERMTDLGHQLIETAIVAVQRADPKTVGEATELARTAQVFMAAALDMRVKILGHLPDMAKPVQAVEVKADEAPVPATPIIEGTAVDVSPGLASKMDAFRRGRKDAH